MLVGILGHCQDDWRKGHSCIDGNQIGTAVNIKTMSLWSNGFTRLLWPTLTGGQGLHGQSPHVEHLRSSSRPRERGLLALFGFESGFSHWGQERNGEQRGKEAANTRGYIGHWNGHKLHGQSPIAEQRGSSWPQPLERRLFEKVGSSVKLLKEAECGAGACELRLLWYAYVVQFLVWTKNNMDMKRAVESRLRTCELVPVRYLHLRKCGSQCFGVRARGSRSDVVSF